MDYHKIPFKTREVFRRLLGDTYFDCSIFSHLERKKFKGWQCSGREEINQKCFKDQCQHCPKYQPKKALWRNGKTV